MAGYTDHVFRQTCRLLGAGMTCTEMISAKAMHFKDKKTAVLAELFPGEEPISIQIFGKEPDIMAEAARTPRGMAAITAAPRRSDRRQ